MIYTLEQYQENAVNDCLNDMAYHVTQDREKPHVAILRAIMGSGKTVMAASLIERLLTSDEIRNRSDFELCVIWLSRGSGGLHVQSGEKLKMLLSDTPAVSVISVESSSDFVAQRFSDNEVYVINWEKVNNSEDAEVENELMVESERPNLISAYRNSSNVKFVFIVDECHQNWETAAYKRLVMLFHPSVVLGMSATPTDKQLLDADNRFPVPVKNVIESGMIRDSVYFNTTVDLPVDTSYASSEQFFLAAALAKRAELERRYRANGSNVTPLLLVQFDNQSSNDSIAKVRDWLETIFADEVDGKYAIWISESSSKKYGLRSSDDVIRKLDTNDVRVLLFKVAVATGWDCPRAQILLRYRKVAKSKLGKGCPFDIQTLGRILRTAERHSYDDEALNAAYVYVPEENIVLEEVFMSAYGGDGGIKTKRGTTPRTSGSPVDTATKQQFVDTNPQANKVISVSDNTDGNGSISDDTGSLTTHQIIDGDFFETVVHNIETTLEGLNAKSYTKYPTTSDVTRKMRELVDCADLHGLTEVVGRKIRFTTHTISVTDELIDGKSSTNIADAKTSLVGEISPGDALQQVSRQFKRIIGDRHMFDDNVKSNFEKYVYSKFEIMSGLDDKADAHVWAAHAIMYANDGHNLGELRRVVDDLAKWQEDAKRIVFKATNFAFPPMSLASYDDKYRRVYPGSDTSRLDSANEVAFVQMLESANNDNVLFWYKNPTSGGNALCVAYDREAGKDTYPDFIVAFVDSSVGIYEIKDACSNIESDEIIDAKNVAIKNLVKDMQSQAPAGVTVYGGVLHIGTDIEHSYILERPEELNV